MSTRFITNITLAVAGVVIVVASQAFSAGPTGWLTFGISLGVLAVLGAAQLDQARGPAQQALDAATVVLALWAAVASAVYTGSTLTWLSLAEGLGFAGLAAVGLVGNELTNERAAKAAVQPRAEGPSARRSEQLSTAA